MLKNKKLNNVKKIFVWSFVMVAMAAIALAEGDKSPLQTVLEKELVQVETTEAVVVDDQPISDVEENVTAVVAQVVEEKQVEVEVIVDESEDLTPGGDIQSINFKKDMGIRDALRFLSVKYQRNIVPTPKVDGQLAFNSLYDVSFDEAMEAILGTSFRYEQSGNLIRVYTNDEYKTIKTDKERMEHQVFTLSYISAAEAMKLITPVLSGSGIVNASSESETGVPTGESISSDSGGGDTMAAKDIIVVYDYPENVKKVAEVIKNLDSRPKQVLIEATILSALLTDNMTFGVDLNLFNGGTTMGGVSNIDVANGNPIQTTGFTAGANIAGLKIGVSMGDIAGFITALETVTDTTILANPKIMAVNKQLGQVYIGKKIGYLAQTTQTDGGSTTSEVKFLDTGTKLSFRPYIGDDGYIRMDIHPKDSTGIFNVVSQAPDETSTELSTNIIVKDGQTIVIGGLFRDKVASTKSQVPVLGDIPFLGEAFKKTTDDTERQEVIVLLTPHIIKDTYQANGAEREQDVLRKRDGANKELHWFGRTKLVEDRYEKAAKYYINGDKEDALRELDWVLQVQPTHLESIRLQEKILKELYPDDENIIERDIPIKVEGEDDEKWGRW